MSRPKRRWRYVVTECWAETPPGIAPGAVIVDTWHGRRYTWELVNLETGKLVGTWTASVVGEYLTPEGGR